ncbi:MAG TPA: glycosyltransferase family 39 protein, partial [Polyangiaceae bacterium]
MMERTLAPSSRRFATSLLSGELALIVAVVVVWLVVAARFASAQEIWVDETTQLSGLTLGPMEVVGWLGGDRQDRFDVPGDRMPPVSYWLGSAWASLFGATENSLRALGIVLVGAAAALIASAAHRAWGSLAGWISGIAFALSPNAILSGVEIRAYPLLIFLSAVAFWLMVALEDVECVRRPSRWVALAATCIVAAYTHFFGLVLAGAVFLGLLAFDSVRKEGRAYWLLGTGMIAVASVGLLPFIRAAMNISPSGTEPKEVLPGVVRLAYRTLGGHPALAVYWPVLVAGLTGALIVLAAVPLPKRRARVGHALALSLGAGF